MSRVSVIIPARNAATTIAQVLASLVPDRDLIGEIILIDDRSDDATAERAQKAAQDLGLPLAAHSLSAGSAGAARNAGLDRARLPMIYFIDADDVLLPGGLAKLAALIETHADAGLAIGTSIRKTPGAKDLTRVPSGYGGNRTNNAKLYLFNGAPPISMGSGLVRAADLGDIRFPENIAIDEDTWFWTALLASTGVVTTADPVLHYHLDGQRTALRYLDRPNRAWLDISLAFRRLQTFGVTDAPLKWRRAWIAQRFARQLIKHGRHEEAAAMLRPVLAHPRLKREWRTTRYRILSDAGRRFGKISTTAPALRNNRAHRTLIVSHDPAWPPVSGADLRNFQNARAAADFGPTRLLSVRSHDEDVAPDGDISIGSLTRTADPRGSSLNWPRSRVEPRIPGAARERLLDEVRQFRPDSVVIEGIGLQAFMPSLRNEVPQIVIDMHNVETDLARQLQPVRGRSVAARIDLGLMRRRERQALSRADRVWTCTRSDRERLLRAYRVRKPVHVVPNGIPRFEEIPGQLGEGPDFRRGPAVLFVGHLGYQPNIDAAKRLASGIFPLIRASFPDATLLLAGRYPKSAVTALAALPGVELHENPDHLVALFNRASLSIVPLRSGGGSRIKILEAAAWGIPVVATPLAAEGLELEPGRQIGLSETDAGLAQLAIDLLDERDQWKVQRDQARLAAIQCYGPDAIRSAVRAGIGLDP